jgi:hypothetical protein
MRTLLPLLLLACAEESVCLDRLDANGDGVCDADTVDWSEGHALPAGTHRGDLYGYDDPALLAEVHAEGIGHAMIWPIEVTGLLIPMRPIDTFLGDADNAGLANLAELALGFGSMEAFYDWLGLARFPGDEAQGIYNIPRPPGMAPGDPLGAGSLQTPWGEGLSMSCATCHAGSLFGRTVMGLSNRRVRANALFVLASELASGFPPELFRSVFEATEAETAMYARNFEALSAIDAKAPEVLGLDTAVAQVGLALAHRQPDPDGTPHEVPHLDPALAHLTTLVADVKPAVWWNLRYKTRWSSDGNLAAGNPMIYSLLANELGRGTDLVALRRWLADNQRTIDVFTAAMFATEPPRWTDFFGTEGLDEEQARRGQALYEARCASCHGSYVKGWESDGGTAIERFASVSLDYPSPTPVIDVGTDPNRREAAIPLAERLNGLAIVQDAGSVFREVEGYVPPPLDGLWARYPYLHNNSVPTLCDLLSPPEERTGRFWQGPAEDPATDFDAVCVGYPTGEAVPEGWKEEEALMDTTIPGLTNVGHDQMLRDAEGRWVLTDQDRDDLVMFLKTL